MWTCSGRLVWGGLDVWVKCSPPIPQGPQLPQFFSLHKLLHEGLDAHGSRLRNAKARPATGEGCTAPLVLAVVCSRWVSALFVDYV